MVLLLYLDLYVTEVPVILPLLPTPDVGFTKLNRKHLAQTLIETERFTNSPLQTATHLNLWLSVNNLFLLNKKILRQKVITPHTNLRIRP